MSTDNHQFKLNIVGDCAVSVEFGNEISLEINSIVRALLHRLKTQQIDGIIEMVPTYTKLTIHYQPDRIKYKKLLRQIRKAIKSLNVTEIDKRLIVEIPVRYGGEFGPDLEECAAFEKVTCEELIKLHSDSLYYTFMLGFAPGHAYTARFENPFSFKRKESPRVKIPAGSIVASENLSNIIPFDQPCGWHIIGYTPIKIFDAAQEHPSLIKAGDWVKYIPITQKEYDGIMLEVARGTYQCKKYMVDNNQ